MVSKEATKAVADFLAKGNPWQRVRTSVDGLFYQIMPKSKNLKRKVAVNVNPLDGAGKPAYKKGLFIRTVDELDAYLAVLNDPKTREAVMLAESINPEVAYQPVVAEIEI